MHQQPPLPAAEMHLVLRPPSPQLPQRQTAHQGLPVTALLQGPVWGLRELPPRQGQ